jgi:hypothetical protein
MPIIFNLQKFTQETIVRHWWFTPVILVIWEAEIGRITVRGQPRQIVHETLSPK